jgi:hypothetical protein
LASSSGVIQSSRCGFTNMSALVTVSTSCKIDYFLF